MHVYKLIITPYAYNDLKSVRDYIRYELKSPMAAKKLLLDIRQAIFSLKTFPERFPRFEHEPWHSKDLRKVTVKNYNIYYWIDESNLTVYITAIFYRAKDQKKSLTHRYDSQI